MENEMQEFLKDFVCACKDAEMFAIGLGGELALSRFESDDDRVRILNFYNKILDEKNYFAVTSHKNNIFEGTDFNTKRICNPLIEGEKSENQWDLYNKWLSASLNKKLVLVEIGEGFNNPNVFRWPFEKVVAINQKSKMFRIHKTFYQLPAEITERAKSLKADGMTFLCELMDYIEDLC
jgi:hypothetical protein